MKPPGLLFCFVVAARLWLCPLHAAVVTDAFDNDPRQTGWKTFGDESLFQWNKTNQALQVTWDSGRTNSYFYRPLGTVLSKNDSFSLSFDLALQEISVGVRPNHPFTFQLSVGFLSIRHATNSTFRRGTGSESPNLVEFDYFADSGFGATVSPVIVSTNGQFIPSFTFPLELTPGGVFQIVLNYSATNQTLTTKLNRQGQSLGPIKDVILPASFTDFRVDALAVSSFNDAGSNGSLLARGLIDNMRMVLPDPPVQGVTGMFEGRQWKVQFVGQSNWIFVLEKSSDLIDWRPITSLRSARIGEIELIHSNPDESHALYRIRADRP